MNPPTSRPRAVAPLVVVALAAVAAYANTLRSAFLFDDSVNIVANEAVHSLSSFTSLGRLIDASVGPTNLKYATAVRPVAYLTFALNYAVGGADTFGYHLVNLAIHLVSAFLVYALTRALLATPAFAARRGPDDGPDRLLETWAPFLVAVLFACHPLQTQAVTYITQRFASLAALFYLGAVLLHVRWRLEGEPRGLRVGAIALALLAAMTKELSATLPAVLFLLELVFFSSSVRSAARRVWPFLLAVAVIPALTFYASQHVGVGLQDAVARGQLVPDSLSYLLTQTTVVVMYVGLLFWPAHLNFDYDYPVYHSLADPRVAASVALLVVLAGAAIFLLVRAQRTSGGGWAAMIGFGVLWFLITLSVESSVVPLADLVDEYRLYLPSIGLIWAVVFAVLAAVERRPVLVRRAAVAGLCVAAALLGFTTFQRNGVYRDEVTLWEDTVEKSPLKPRPHTNLSVAYGRAGREEESILEYQAAAFLNPEFRKTHGKLGVKQEEFEQVMRSAAARFVGRHLTDGVAALDRRDLNAAEVEFRAALKLDPSSADAHSDLGLVHLLRGRSEEAIRENREAVRLAPNRADLLRNLGVALSTAGRSSEALEALNQAVAMDPADAQSKGMIEQLSRRR